MKVNKATYTDDDVTIPGVLVKRFLRKPVFYAAVVLLGGCGSGKVRVSAAPWHLTEQR